MRTISVDKEKLIEVLTENRDAHHATFEAALAVYRNRMVDELERMLDEARNGQPIRRSFSMPVPEDHTDDFNRALQMLDWELSSKVDLDEQQFAQFVQNEWGWARSFAGNTEAYLVQ